VPFCTDCGSEVEDAWRFCRTCGTAQAVVADDALDGRRRAPLVAGPDFSSYPPPPMAGPSSALRTLGIWVQVGLWACVAASVLLLIVSIAAHAAYDRFRDRLSTGTLGDAVDAKDGFEGVLGLWVILALAAGILFIIWLYQAGSLVRREGRSGGFGPGWAIGGWFIPLASFVLPVLYVSELWRMTDPAIGPENGERWRDRPTDAKVWTWWAMFSVAAVLLVIALAQTGDGTATNDAPPWQAEFKFAAVASVLYVAAGAIGVLMVRHLGRRLSAIGADPTGR
jgi:hypothetical protein